MSDTVITVENLCKKYTIDHQKEARYQTFRENLNHMGKGMLERLRHPLSPNKENVDLEDFWALKDINFEIKRGDRVGIIGRNGAGKSTLLKILSRITEPTNGRVTLKDRVASLLEVGTGFHPELTGRENVFLNGAILGMSRVEIKKKFEEIVEFAEIENFLDTPVKRYSSGMYVRLAFAVAAHLESAILLVDEVLAVGDFQFQKKCLGKMEEISNEGRTVLFVSHNMGAIKNICSRVILLKNSHVMLDSNTDSVIKKYLTDDISPKAQVCWDETEAPQSPEIRFNKAYILNDQLECASSIDNNKQFYIIVEYDILKTLRNLRIGFFMRNLEGIVICGSNDPEAWLPQERPAGHYRSKCSFPSHILNEGKYSLYLGADIPPYKFPLVTTPYCLTFTIVDVTGHGANREKLPGIVRPKLQWDVKHL